MPDPAPPLVRLDRVTKRFDAVAAVDGASLEVRRGELFCLLGGSGSGKTTLLRMLAGFETPTSGRIEIDGQDMTKVPPYARPVNMMFQSYALFPHMSVARNVGYGLRRGGVPRRDVAARVDAMLRMVKMQDYAARKPHQLSGGQRQRVALARALIKQPKLLLLDEPLGALDKKLREETQFELMRIQEQLGVTFIVVTHDQEEAMVLADRIGVMRDGQIVQIGPPREIYEHPNSRFTADFIGSITLFEGRVVEEGAAHVLIDSPEFGGRIHVEDAASSAPGRAVAVAVRPEKISMTRAEPDQSAGPSGRNVVSGIVQGVAYVGDASLYRVRLDSGKIALASQPNQSRRAEAQIASQERVWLSWGAQDAVVLTS